jgi:hypothetical protein
MGLLYRKVLAVALSEGTFARTTSYILQINNTTLFASYSVGVALCVHVRDGFVRVYARAELSTSGSICVSSGLHWWRLLEKDALLPL